MTTNDNAFVRGIRRAVEQRKQREQQAAIAAITIDSPVMQSHSPAVLDCSQTNDCSPVNDDEKFRLDLVNKIITYIRKNRKELTQ